MALGDWTKTSLEVGGAGGWLLPPDRQGLASFQQKLSLAIVTSDRRERSKMVAQ